MPRTEDELHALAIAYAENIQRIMGIMDAAVPSAVAVDGECSGFMLMQVHNILTAHDAVRLIVVCKEALLAAKVAGEVQDLGLSAWVEAPGPRKVDIDGEPRDVHDVNWRVSWTVPGMYGMAAAS